MNERPLRDIVSVSECRLSPRVPSVFTANEERRGHRRSSIACLGQHTNLPFQVHIL